MGEMDSLLDSDVLICDWSAMAIEYGLGLGKPVLFVDVPPRVRNPKYAELGLEPMEMRIRRELGTVLPLNRLAEAPAYVADLIRGAGAFRDRMATLRAHVGCSISDAASRSGLARSRASPTSGPPHGEHAPTAAPLGQPVRPGQCGGPGHHRPAVPLALCRAISPAVAWTYAVVAYVGHMAGLAYGPLLLLVPSCCSCLRLASCSR
jgi:hypothetical protein